MKPSGSGILFVWKIFDYSFNFCACDGSVKIFYFFLVEFWKVVLFYIKLVQLYARTVLKGMYKMNTPGNSYEHCLQSQIGKV